MPIHKPDCGFACICMYVRMYVRMYVWTHAIAAQGHYYYHCHHTGRAIWHEQHQQSMSMSWPQSTVHSPQSTHYSCTPALHASPLYACPLSQRLLLARSPTTNQSSNELVGCRRCADTGVRAAAKPLPLTGPISCSMHSGGVRRP